MRLYKRGSAVAEFYRHFYELHRRRVYMPVPAVATALIEVAMPTAKLTRRELVHSSIPEYLARFTDADGVSEPQDEALICYLYFKVSVSRRGLLRF